LFICPTITQKHLTSNDPNKFQHNTEKTPPTLTKHPATVQARCRRQQQDDFQGQINLIGPALLINPNGTVPFALENLSRSYGTLLGAVLATSFDAISRDQVCVRLSSSITFDRKQKHPPNSDDNHNKKLRFTDRLNRSIVMT